MSRADAGLDKGEGITKNSKPASMCGLVLLCVFKYLSVADLLSVMRVCKEWARWSIHPSLWSHITLPPNKPVRTEQLEGIVRRQPSKITCSWVIITEEQLKWLLTRLPQLSEAEFEGLSWGEVRCLATCYSPPLVKLNLGFCEGINDDAIKQFLSSPVSRRPGFRNHQASRMKSITHLSLAGSFISDISMKAICSELQLIHLDISNSVLVTEETIHVIVENLKETLESLDLRACVNIGPLCLPDLVKLKYLSRLCFGHCDLIPIGAVRVWAQAHGYTVDKDQTLTRIPPSVRQVNLAIQSRLVKTAFQEILKTHIQKLSQNASFSNKSCSVSPRDNNSKNNDDFSPQSVELKSNLFVKTPTSTPSQNISDPEPGNNIEVSCSSNEKKGRLLKNVDRIELEQSLDAESKKIKANREFLRNTTGMKVREISSGESSESKISHQKCSYTGNSPVHLEISPTRPRRRPSRFSDPDVEFSSPSKHPRKKMKQVTVELEDINKSKTSSIKPSEYLHESDFEKPLKLQKKRSMIGPKSRCSPRIDETISETFKTDVEPDITESAAGDEVQQSPRRTQRRSREASAENKDQKNKEIHSSKKAQRVEDSSSICDIEVKQTEIQKRDLEDDKNVFQLPVPEYIITNLKKDKDIMTRSKRLKQEPCKDHHEDNSNISSGAKSPRVMISRNEIDTNSNNKNKLETFVSKLKTSVDEGDKIPKRSRSGSLTDVNISPTKKAGKGNEPIYSSKLRNKSIEGSISCENFGKKSPMAEEVLDPRPRRRSLREDDKVVSEASNEAHHSRVLFQCKDSEEDSKLDSSRKSPKYVEKKKLATQRSDLKKNTNLKSIIGDKESKLDTVPRGSDSVKDCSADNKQKDASVKCNVQSQTKKNSKGDKSEPPSCEIKYSNIDIGNNEEITPLNPISKGLVRRSSSDKLLVKSKDSNYCGKEKYLSPKKKYSNEKREMACKTSYKAKGDHARKFSCPSDEQLKYPTSSTDDDKMERDTSNETAKTSVQKLCETDYQKVSANRYPDVKSVKHFSEKKVQVHKVAKDNTQISEKFKQATEVSSDISSKNSNELKISKIVASTISQEKERKNFPTSTKEDLSKRIKKYKDSSKDETLQTLIVKRKGSKHVDADFKPDKHNERIDSKIIPRDKHKNKDKRISKDGETISIENEAPCTKIEFKRSSDKSGVVKLDKNEYDRVRKLTSKFSKPDCENDGASKDSRPCQKLNDSKPKSEPKVEGNEAKPITDQDKITSVNTGDFRKGSNKIPAESKVERATGEKKSNEEIKLPKVKKDDKALKKSLPKAKLHVSSASLIQKSFGSSTKVSTDYKEARPFFEKSEMKEINERKIKDGIIENIENNKSIKCISEGKKKDSQCTRTENESPSDENSGGKQDQHTSIKFMPAASTSYLSKAVSSQSRSEDCQTTEGRSVTRKEDLITDQKIVYSDENSAPAVTTANKCGVGGTHGQNPIAKEK